MLPTQISNLPHLPFSASNNRVPDSSSCLVSMNDLQSLRAPVRAQPAIAGAGLNLSISTEQVRRSLARPELDEAGRQVTARMINIFSGADRSAKVTVDRRATFAFTDPDPAPVVADIDPRGLGEPYDPNEVHYPRDTERDRALSGTFIFGGDHYVVLYYQIKSRGWKDDFGVSSLIVRDQYGGQFQVIGDDSPRSSTLWMIHRDLPAVEDLPRTYQISTRADVKMAIRQFPRLSPVECDELYDRIFFGVSRSDFRDRLFYVFDMQHELSAEKQDDLLDRIATAYHAPENVSHKPMLRSFSPANNNQARVFNRMSVEQRQKWADLFGVART